MATDEKTVAVVSVTYNSEHLLRDFLVALDEGLKGVSWRLTVADNASADNTVSTLRRLAPEATLVEMGRNAGYAAGINAAVKAAPAHSAILVLNPDVRLMPGCVVELLGALAAGYRPGRSPAARREIGTDRIHAPGTDRPTGLGRRATRRTACRALSSSRRGRHRQATLSRTDRDRLGRGLDAAHQRGMLATLCTVG